jgi:hypothetical protein
VLQGERGRSCICVLQGERERSCICVLVVPSSPLFLRFWNSFESVVFLCFILLRCSFTIIY